MSDHLPTGALLADIMNAGPTTTSVSGDGAAVTRTGEIAPGIPISMTAHPSNSAASGIGVQANVDGARIGHIEGAPQH
jgi:hypothetical protein